MFKRIRLRSSISRLVEERLYEVALDELKKGAIRNGIWAKALTMSGGDEALTNSKYIELRVESLKDEADLIKAIEEEAHRHKKPLMNSNPLRNEGDNIADKQTISDSVYESGGLVLAENFSVNDQLKNISSPLKMMVFIKLFSLVIAGLLFLSAFSRFGIELFDSIIAWDIYQSVGFMLFQYLLTFLTGFLFFSWISLARKLALENKDDHLVFSVRNLLMFCFVPIANFWLPLKSFKKALIIKKIFLRDPISAKKKFYF